MATEQGTAPSSFGWNAGGWFGSQIGSTLWMLILGLVLFTKDSVSAWVCVVGFLGLNALGVYLWRSQGHLSAFAGLQRFLLVESVIIAVVVLVVNLRGVSEPPAPGALVSTYLPYWVIAIAPGFLVVFYLREPKVRASQS